MKNLIRLFGLAILALLAQSCGNDNEPMADGNHRYSHNFKAKMYSFNLSFGGQYIEQGEEPITKASDPNTYVGINVSRKPQGDSSAESEYYAYGVFTKTTDINIRLEGGYSYDFEATILRDAVDKLHVTSSEINKPFQYTQLIENNKINATDINFNLKKDKFIYNNTNDASIQSGYLHQLSDGTANVDLTLNNAPDTKNFMYPRVDRYYGKSTGIIPEELIRNNTGINIDLSYQCFGVKIKIESLPEGTTLSVKDQNFDITKNKYDFLMIPEDLVLSNSTETSGDSEWSCIYSLNKLTEENSPSFTLEFSWNKGMGVVEKFKENIVVQRGKYRVLKINLDGNAVTHADGNIILSEGSNTLGDDNNPIEITNPTTIP